MRKQIQHTRFRMKMSNDSLSLRVCYWHVQENKNIAPTGNSKNYIRPRYNPS